MPTPERDPRNAFWRDLADTERRVRALERKSGSGGAGGPAYVLPTPIPDANLPHRIAAGAWSGAQVADANSARESGWYWLPGDTAANAPTPSHYLLQVVAGNVNFLVQIAYYCYGTEVYRRSTSDGSSWSPWAKLAPAPAVDDATLPPRLRSAGKPTNDANAVNEDGWYTCQTPSTANLPAGASPYGMLEHNGWDTGNGHAAQLFFPMYDQTVWFRACVTYAWQPWKKIVPIDDTNLPMRLRGFRTATGDFNTATQAGWYCGGGGTINGPPTSYGEYSNVYVGAADNQQISQIALPFWNAEVWNRRMHSGVWQPWTRVYPPVIDDSVLPARLGGLDNTQVANMDTEIYESGFYSTTGGPVGAPEAGNYFHTLSLNRGDGWRCQIATGFYRGETYVRQYEGGWTPWKRLFNDKTDTRLRSQTGAAPKTDANLCEESGWYGINTGGANLPTPDGPCHIEVYCWDIPGNVIVQFCHVMNGNRSWKRYKWGGWSAWEQMWPITDTARQLPARIGPDVTANTVTDANQADYNGWWYAAPAAINTPYGADWFIFAMCHGYRGYIVKQIAYQYYGNAIFQRQKDWQGLWSRWYKVTDGRRTIGGTASGTLNSAGYGNFPWGETVNTVHGVTISNKNSAKNNVLYSVVDSTNVVECHFCGWVVTNQPDVNAPFTVCWTAVVD